MTDVEIEWDSLSIHRGTFTVLLRGDWAHDSTWMGVFNESVPPVLSTSWGQITAGPSSTLAGWGHIAATIDGKITVQTLRPGNANQLRETLEQLAAAANAKMASLGEYQRTERPETQGQVEQDARDQAMMDEFRQPKS
jgi:hypothetical protein